MTTLHNHAQWSQCGVSHYTVHHNLRWTRCTIWLEDGSLSFYGKYLYTGWWSPFLRHMYRSVPFFWSFAAEWMLKNTKRSPFQFFWNCETCFFSPKVPPSIFLMICDRRDEKCQSVPLARQSDPTFGFLGSFRREYFDTLKSVCYFRALDITPTWAVPGLFYWKFVLFIVGTR